MHCLWKTNEIVKIWWIPFRDYIVYIETSWATDSVVSLDVYTLHSFTAARTWDNHQDNDPVFVMTCRIVVSSVVHFSWNSKGSLFGSVDVALQLLLYQKSPPNVFTTKYERCFSEPHTVWFGWIIRLSSFFWLILSLGQQIGNK